jgi:YD repeat-containing protein
MGGEIMTRAGLTYNQTNRLATVLAGASQVAGYTYDAFGHQIVKTAGSTNRFCEFHPIRRRLRLCPRQSEFISAALIRGK